jgi:hypothetical protein
VDFAGGLAVIHDFLARRGVRSAVIGGVALAAYGHPRMTLDLDFVTEAAAQDIVVAFMESRGFRTLHRSTGYSNHRHADATLGRVDFMYVQGRTSELVFASTRELAGPGGVPITVPKPEHLIAMKVRAMKEAPERTWQDLADIGFLLRLPDIDRTEVQGTSRVPAWRRSGMNSRALSDEGWVDLERDVPTTAVDVDVLRRLRGEAPSWFSLTAAQLQAAMPPGALDRRPAMRNDARPFTLA